MPSRAISSSRKAQAPARLIFDDEFDGAKLDRGVWFWCYPWGSPRDCTNGQRGLPFREREQYRNSQIEVRNGALHLIAVRHSVKPHFPWTSGMITTGGRFENGPPKPAFTFEYGYAEMRARLPRGHGFWPAFWLVPGDGSWPPEIDIMEWQGAQPRRDYMTVHFSDRDKKDDSIGAAFDGAKLWEDFHVYAIDWRPDKLTWYVDDTPRFEVSAKEIESRGGRFPSRPMYVILNLALGGWVTPPNRRTPSPADMVVDYVRVWNRKPG